MRTGKEIISLYFASVAGQTEDLPNRFWQEPCVS